MRYIATKAFTYSTRRLAAGDELPFKPAICDLLVRIGKARKVDGRAAQPLSPPSPELAAKMAQAAGLSERNPPPSAAPTPPPGGEDLAALRAQYAEVLGKRPFNGWDAATLKAKIAQAAGA